MFIILLPLAFILILSSLDINRAVYGTDVDMQQGLNDACRSATMQVAPLSQAYNDPKIDAGLAYTSFKSIMAKNLHLNSDLSTPTNGSYTGLTYIFIVVNGTNNYGLPEIETFSNTNTSGTISSATLPYTYTVGSSINVKLDSPGCIAVVNAGMSPIVGSQTNTGVRWSSAKIYKP